MSNRTKLLAGTGALALVQLTHLLDVLRYSDTATFPRVLADPIALTGIGTATLAFAALAIHRPGGATLALVAGSAIALGFTLYHGLPFDLGVNNPYWGTGESSADLIQWSTVIGAIAVGAWTARTAWHTAWSAFSPVTLTSVRGLPDSSGSTVVVASAPCDFTHAEKLAASVSAGTAAMIGAASADRAVLMVYANVPATNSKAPKRATRESLIAFGDVISSHSSGCRCRNE